MATFAKETASACRHPSSCYYRLSIAVSTPSPCYTLAVLKKYKSKIAGPISTTQRNIVLCIMQVAPSLQLGSSCAVTSNKDEPTLGQSLTSYWSDSVRSPNRIHSAVQGRAQFAAQERFRRCSGPQLLLGPNMTP